MGRFYYQYSSLIDLRCRWLKQQCGLVVRFESMTICACSSRCHRWNESNEFVDKRGTENSLQVHSARYMILYIIIIMYAKLELETHFMNGFVNYWSVQITYRYVLNACLYCVLDIFAIIVLLSFFYKLHNLFLRTQTLEICSCQQDTRLTWYIKTQTSLFFHALASLVRIFVILSFEPPEHSSGI